MTDELKRTIIKWIGITILLAPALLNDKDLLSIRELQFGNRIIELKENDLNDITMLYDILRKRHQTAREIELTNPCKNVVKLIGDIDNQFIPEK